MTQTGSPDPCNDLVCITSSVLAISFKPQLPIVSAAARQRPHLLEFLSLQRNHIIALRCRRVAPSTASSTDLSRSAHHYARRRSVQATRSHNMINHNIFERELRFGVWGFFFVDFSRSDGGSNRSLRASSFTKKSSSSRTFADSNFVWRSRSLLMIIGAAGFNLMAGLEVQQFGQSSVFGGILFHPGQRNGPWASFRASSVVVSTRSASGTTRLTTPSARAWDASSGSAV